MIRLRAALRIFMLSVFCFTPPAVSAEYVIELPVLAAIHANNKGVFEMLMIWWDQKQSPDSIQLRWLDAGVHFGGTQQSALAQAFAYAVERTPNVRHSGTASVRGFAYTSTTTDGPSAGAAMAVGFIAMFKGDRLLRGIAMTGTLEPGGRIGPVGAIPDKMRAAAREGYRTILVPAGQVYGPSWNLNQVAMDLNLVVKEVDTIDLAYELMTGQRI